MRVMPRSRSKRHRRYAARRARTGSARGTAQLDLQAVEGLTIIAAGGDGIDAGGTAGITVEMPLQDDEILGVVEIDAMEIGIKANENSGVALTAQTCNIAGDRDAIRIRGNATVDTNDCVALNLSGE